MMIGMYEKLVTSLIEVIVRMDDLQKVILAAYV